MNQLLTKVNLFVLTTCLAVNVFTVSALAQVPQERLNRFVFNAMISGDIETVRAILRTNDIDINVADENNC